MKTKLSHYQYARIYVWHKLLNHAFSIVLHQSQKQQKKASDKRQKSGLKRKWISEYTKKTFIPDRQKNLQEYMQQFLEMNNLKIQT